MNSAEFRKIGHHRIRRISANSAEFVNLDLRHLRFIWSHRHPFQRGAHDPSNPDRASKHSYDWALSCDNYFFYELWHWALSCDDYFSSN
jgi:hypothetical protein